MKNVKTDPVVTSTGHEWKQLNEGWLDVQTGLVWFPSESKTYTYPEAIEKFNTANRRLPSISEYKIAKQHGMCEVLSDMKNKWFWSSSARLSSVDFAWFFYGGDGVADFGYRYNDGAVRCVAKL